MPTRNTSDNNPEIEESPTEEITSVPRVALETIVDFVDDEIEEHVEEEYSSDYAQQVLNARNTLRETLKHETDSTDFLLHTEVTIRNEGISIQVYDFSGIEPVVIDETWQTFSELGLTQMEGSDAPSSERFTIDNEGTLKAEQQPDDK
jgi:hypothetical protein